MWDYHKRCPPCLEEWANSDSITQQISKVSQMGPLAQAKQFIADRLAGEYDAERIGSLIDEKINSNKFLALKSNVLDVVWQPASMGDALTGS